MTTGMGPGMAWMMSETGRWREMTSRKPQLLMDRLLMDRILEYNSSNTIGHLLSIRVTSAF